MYQEQAKFSGNLHALRGLAAVSVVFYHAWGMNPAMPDIGWMGFVKQFGAGVTLFFVLSGFSLSLSNYDQIDKLGWLRGYSIKRIARIMPVWYVFIAITWLNHAIHLNYSPPSNTVLFSMIPFYSIIPGREQGLVWAGWTIGIELMFYMIFPIMLVLFRNNLKVWGLASVALIAVSLKLRGYAGPDATAHFLQSSFPRQAFIFVMGCTFYFTARQAIAQGWERVLAIAMLLMSITFFGIWIGETQGWISHHKDFRLIVKAFALCGLTVFAFTNPKLKGLPQLNLYNPLTKLFGDKSYTIYLAHPIIISWTRGWVDPIFETISNTSLAFLCYAFIVLIITCAAAAVISTLIEAPLYKRGRALAQKEMAAASTTAN